MSRKDHEKSELDLSSPNFDARKALRRPDKVVVPYPSAPVYDNISSFIETPEGIFPKPKRLPKEKKDEPKSNRSDKNESRSENQKGIQEKIITGKNVITRMEETVKGPLTFIKKCMDEKLRVKVYTRGAVNVRGYCLGYVVAFDKHMNLVLKDVFEIWTRRRKRKVPFLGPVTTSEQTSRDVDSDCDILSSRFQLDSAYAPGTPIVVDKKPKIVVRKRLKRREICERHIDQLLIRGEQIVIVTLEPT